MKKTIATLLFLSLVFSFVLGGCSRDASEAAASNGSAESTVASSEVTDPQSAETSAADLKIALIVNGNLGDKSFFDSANEGMLTIKEKYGCTIKVIETGTDTTKWEPALADVSEEGYDIIIVGTYDMVEPLTKIATEYPNQKYIIFDDSVDYSDGQNPNVYSVNYRQCDVAFIGGYIATRMTKTDTIGIVAAVDAPLVNDWIVGTIQGLKYADSEMGFTLKFIGSFSDVAKAKEIALAQYNSGCDFIINLGANAGLGIIDAAKETGKLCIGTDSDQAMLFQGTDPDKSNCIPTSMLKRVDLSLIRAIDLYLENKLPFGSCETLGISDGCVGIAENEYYMKLVPEDVRTEVEDITNQLVSGEITVTSVFDMTTEELDAIRTPN